MFSVYVCFVLQCSVSVQDGGNGEMERLLNMSLIVLLHPGDKDPFTDYYCSAMFLLRVEMMVQTERWLNVSLTVSLQL